MYVGGMCVVEFGGTRLIIIIIIVTKIDPFSTALFRVCFELKYKGYMYI